jgi:predicted FMN-binding regulatory protein PaiB
MAWPFFLKPAHLTKLPRHHPLFCVYGQEHASPLFCFVPFVLSRAYSVSQRFIEHLARAVRELSPRADQHSPAP